MYVKRSPFQNNRIAVWQLAFRARKVIGNFEKQSPNLDWGASLRVPLTNHVQEITGTRFCINLDWLLHCCAGSMKRICHMRSRGPHFSPTAQRPPRRTVSALTRFTQKKKKKVITEPKSPGTSSGATPRPVVLFSFSTNYSSDTN